MVAVTPTITSSKQTVVTPAVEKKYVSFEAKSVNVNDTIPISELSGFLGVATAVFKKADGAAVAHTRATNIITITEVGLANTDLVGYAYGN